MVISLVHRSKQAIRHVILPMNVHNRWNILIKWLCVCNWMMLDHSMKTNRRKNVWRILVFFFLDRIHNVFWRNWKNNKKQNRMLKKMIIDHLFSNTFVQLLRSNEKKTNSIFFLLVEIPSSGCRYLRSSRSIYKWCWRPRRRWRTIEIHPLLRFLFYSIDFYLFLFSQCSLLFFSFSLSLHSNKFELFRRHSVNHRWLKWIVHGQLIEYRVVHQSLMDCLVQELWTWEREKRENQSSISYAWDRRK